MSSDGALASIKRRVRTVAKAGVAALPTRVREVIRAPNYLHYQILPGMAGMQREQDRVSAELISLGGTRTQLDLAVPMLMDAASHLNAAARQARRDQVRTDETLTNHSKDLQGIWANEASFNENLGNVWAKLAEHDANFQQIWQRMELIRREVMIELRYRSQGDQAGGTKTVDEVATRIVDPQALQADELRINLGCGHLPLDGYINVDGRELPGVQVVSELGSLPFEEGSLDEIFSAHLLEHFPEEELRRVRMPYLVGLLKPGGTFRAVVPDGTAVMQGWHDGAMTFEEAREVLYGGQEYAGDFHFTMFSEQTLTEVFEQAGLTDVEVLATGRRNGLAFELEVKGTKPSS